VRSKVKTCPRLKRFARGSRRSLARWHRLSSKRGKSESAGDLIAKHGTTRQIYTLDALQLAVALSVQQPAPIDHFVCADQRLCAIAALEGLAVINPELTP
jgi:hypothetical protein